MIHVPCITGMDIFIGCGYGSHTGIDASTLKVEYLENYQMVNNIIYWLFDLIPKIGLLRY